MRHCPVVALLGQPLTSRVRMFCFHVVPPDGAPSAYWDPGPDRLFKSLARLNAVSIPHHFRNL
jgi:hypothetical protein